MTHFITVGIYVAILLGSSGSCFVVGVKSRGWIPLRSPSNKVRLENAETDAKIAKLNKDRRQTELELEHGEVKAQLAIEEVKKGQKQLTQGKNAEIAEERIAFFIQKHFDTGYGIDTLPAMLTYLEENILMNEERISKLDNHYFILMRELANFGVGQMPRYLQKAYTEAKAVTV